MKNLKLTTLILLVFFTHAAPATKDLCDELDGLWVMTQKTAVHPENSNPIGAINARIYFDKKSMKMHSSIPDDVDVKDDSGKRVLEYTCNDSVLDFKIKKPEGYAPSTSVSIIKSITDEQLVLNIETRSDLFGSNSTEQIYTRSFFKSIGDRFEPMSIEVVQNSDNDLNILDVEYDPKDYSDLSLNKRILGVWEVNRYKNIHRQEMPPYGLLNDIYTIKPNEICMLKRYPPAKTICFPYELKDQTLTWIIKDKQYGDAVSFNEWGHLEL